MATDNLFNGYETDVEKKLKFYFKTDQLRIASSVLEIKYSKLLDENFNFDCGRIQFKENEYLISQSYYNNLNEKDWTTLIKNKLENIADENNLSNTDFILFGDNLLSKAYCFTYSSFLNYFWPFFSIPEHTYILSLDLQFLISYTMEGDLCFIKRW